MKKTACTYMSYCLLDASFELLHPSKPVYAYVLQIIVVANHMSGKDTHVRGLRILGPIEFVLTKFRLRNY
jgi:hypothetical protein